MLPRSQMYQRANSTTEVAAEDASPPYNAAPWTAEDWSCKAVFDFVLAAVMFVLAVPFMLITALLVKFSDRGPVLYCQTRTGKNGRLFTLVKFRTMRVESERHGACWSRPGDPRITAVGRFLRRTHLDELPQLWNVLRGDMSLVGPRPERPEFVTVLGKALPRYRERLLVRPGVTGLAQVQLPADTDLNSVRKKLRRDLYYVQNANPWLDFRILLATACKMFGVPFSTLSFLFGMPRLEEQPSMDANAEVSWNPFSGLAAAPAGSEAG